MLLQVVIVSCTRLNPVLRSSPKRRPFLFTHKRSLCTRTEFVRFVFNGLRTLVLHFSVFMVRVVELCTCIRVGCASCTEKGVGVGGVVTMADTSAKTERRTAAERQKVWHGPASFPAITETCERMFSCEGGYSETG